MREGATVSYWDPEEQEKVEAILRAGKEKDHSFIPKLLVLLGDPSGEVRRYALQALVLDLGKKTEDVTQLCWELLATDPEADVRSMAAASLGSIFHDSRNREAFQRLLALLRREPEDGGVKVSIYLSMLRLAGEEPVEWSGILLTRKQLMDSRTVDLERLTALEPRLR